jgi:hypothetical protein
VYQLIPSQFFRDQLTITTWLALGALFQSLTFVLIGRIALLPAILYIVFSVANASAQAAGWKHNPLMDGVLMEKFSTAFPDSRGKYGSTPADTSIVVFLLGFRNNHPLGIFAPGAKQIGGYFTQMVADLEAHDEEFGLMGMTSWTDAASRKTQSGSMNVGYFKNVEGLHAFAHSDYHMKAWKWWNANVKQWPHLSIWHETYHVPKGSWETIYVNSHISGMPSTRVKTDDGLWVSPVVDASRGLLKTSAGRMSRSQAKEHDDIGGGWSDPYQEKK